MKTQRSRNTFDVRKRYSGVYQQQGRMITDADWNELSDILKERLNDVLRDVVGGGTPRRRGLVAVKKLGGAKSYSLQWGHAYVNGIVGQSRPAVPADPPTAAFEYDNQADFPDPPPLPAGDYCLYLDLWERSVAFFEDPEMRDPGLHGADTCTRTQTMLQVKWCPVDVDPEDPVQNFRIGTAPLTLVLRQGSTAPDPCDPCAAEIELHDNVGDYLFRVEIHDVQYSASGEPETVTLKWSSENGAEHFSVGEEPVGFDQEGWVFDFFSDAATGSVSEKQLGYHLAAGGWTPTRSKLFHVYPDVPPTGFPLVRRWDGAGVFQKTGSVWKLKLGQSSSDRGVPLSSTSDANAPGHVSEGPSIKVNLDAITLTLELASHPLLAGDFWEVAVRRSLNPGDTLLDGVPSQGIVHHYLKLGQVGATGFVPVDDEICKRFNFPPLTDIGADDVCYDNEVCSMPGVDTVKDALDHLCQERDLRWHNKHLHGFGVVCGLQLHCAPRKIDGGDNQDGRRGMRIQKGYALDCEGNDIVVDKMLRLDLIDMIEKADSTNENGNGSAILNENGNGTACLSIELDSVTGQPQIKIEKYNKSHGKWSSLFEDTLLWDFYQDCIVDLLEAFNKHLDLSDDGDSTNPVISVRRRRLVSLIHLFIQFYFTKHGRYIFISPKGHKLLRGLYEELRKLLQSKTFCAMFEGDEFPEYPFPNLTASTAFGKNGHAKVKVHPSGEFLYTYGGPNNLINIYDVKSEELVAVHEMPAGESAEVLAIAFSEDGTQLFAAASLRDEDTIFGFAEISGKDLKWRGTVVICDIIITELVQSTQDNGLIIALGKGKGVYSLRPELLFDLEKTELQPVYAFNAVGHLVVDESFGRAYATASAPDVKPDLYDRFVILSLDNILTDKPADSVDLEQLLLIDGEERVKGDDGLALGSVIQGGRRIHIATDPRKGSKTKHLLTYDIVNFQPGSPRVLNIENTGVSLMLNERTQNPVNQASNQLLVGLAGSFRLMIVSSDGTKVIRPRIPVQIQPTAIAIDPKRDRFFVLNFASNTFTMMRRTDLDVGEEFLSELAEYRRQAILAFVGLAGGLAQYLKDCFCQHLLVNCPACDETDKVYLGVAEIRDKEIYNICNFAKRKDVHTFPKVEYWLSLVPVIPLVKKAVEKICCSVLPDQLDKLAPKYTDQIKTESLDETKTQKPKYPDKQVKRSYVALGRADFEGEFNDLKKRGEVAARLGSDSLILRAEETSPAKGGIRKSALVNADVEAAKAQLKERGVTVRGVKPYDSRLAGKYREFRGTPSRIPRGSKVELYEQDGKVVFYALVKDSPRVEPVSEDIKAEIKDLENRKTDLGNLDEISAELVKLQEARSSVEDVDALKEELNTLSESKTSVQQELVALKSELTQLKTDRENEQEKLGEIEELVSAASGKLNQLKTDVDDIGKMHSEISSEVAKGRPVKDVQGVTKPIDEHLRELGIRTVAELSKAKAIAIQRQGVLTLNQAQKLIQKAQGRLSIR